MGPGVARDGDGVFVGGDGVPVGGVEKRILVLAEHDPAWLDRFDQEQARIIAALGPAAVGVHHIGSTMNDYAEAKGALIAEIVERAESWAAATGWTPDDG